MCASPPKLIFSCSGAADVGAIADQAARKLTREVKGKMFCTVGIGGKVSGILETNKSASKILAIDGCSLNCTKIALSKPDLRISHADIGIAKGKTLPSKENINNVAEKCTELLEC